VGKRRAKAMVFLAPEYVQKRSMSSLFCGCAQNNFRLGKSFCASAKSTFDAKSGVRRLYAQRCDLSSLFAGLRAIYFDWAGLVTGTIIVYNWRRPRKSVANLGKSWQILEDSSKIKLDRKTPRAAPGNNFAMFYEQLRKIHLTGEPWACIIVA